MIAIFLAAMLYWYGVCGLSDVAEPWDSAGYWRAWYPLSLILSGATAATLGRRGWAAGLAILGGLAIPAVMAAAAAGRWAVRRPRA